MAKKLAAMFSRFGLVSRSLNYPNNYTLEESVAQTWSNPADILSLLLLVGGDVIQKAIAQQAGDRYLPTPVIFSFGWVAYAFSALLATVGDNLLMPSTPDCPSLVLNASSGQSRENHSWILGRILRDFDTWQPPQVREALQSMLAEVGATSTRAAKARAGLCISVFQAKPSPEAGVQIRDLYFWSGYGMAALQLVIAAIAWGWIGDWITFLVVVVGTILAFTSSSLRQWRHERWSCRRNATKTCALTHGNGSQHVIVIQGAGCGLDLEDLAGWPESSTASIWTKLANGFLLFCWIILLLTVTGIQNDTWVLLVIGALGMLHTNIVAGAARNPSSFGIHLEFKEVFVDRRAIDALRKTEECFEGLGVSLVSVFFPSEPRRDNSALWYYKAKRRVYEEVTELIDNEPMEKGVTLAGFTQKQLEVPGLQTV